MGRCGKCSICANKSRSCLSLTNRAVQAYESGLKHQNSKVTGMTDSLNAINKSFENLKSSCTKAESCQEQTLAAIEATKQMIMYA
jgi:hypothetical protein